jgi:hypothetical protein
MPPIMQEIIDSHFVLGFFVGMAFAAVLGIAFDQFRHARKKIADFGNPQNVVKVDSTKETPYQKLIGFINGIIGTILWALAITGLMLIFLMMLREGLMQ